MPADALLSASGESLADHFESEYRVSTPVLKEDAIQMDQHETNVDVSHDQSRAIFDRSRPFFIKGSQVDFYVPFEGDAQIFSCRASSFTHNPPRAEVRKGELALSYVRTDHNGAAIKTDFENELGRIRQHLDWARGQIETFNKAIRANAQASISQRRDKLLRDRGMVESLGYPLRRREGAPQTYAVPAVRHKPPIARAATASTAFKPEPALEMAEYDHILKVVSNMVQVMERSPQAFKECAKKTFGSTSWCS